MSVINRLFPSYRKNKYEVLFGAAVSSDAPHGAVKGTWQQEGYRQPITISFRIRGHEIPPKMTPELLMEVFHHARMVGIDPECLTAYYDIHNPRPPAKSVGPYQTAVSARVVPLRSPHR